MNFPLPSLVVNLTYAAENWSPSRPEVVWAVGSGTGLLLVAVAYGAWALRDLPDRQTFALMLGASVAGGLTGWPYYFVLLIPGFALVTVWTIRRPPRLRLAGLALVYLFVMNLMTGAGMRWLGEIGHILVNYLPLYGLLGLLAWLGLSSGIAKEG